MQKLGEREEGSLPDLDAKPWLFKNKFALARNHEPECPLNNESMQLAFAKVMVLMGLPFLSPSPLLFWGPRIQFWALH